MNYNALTDNKIYASGIVDFFNQTGSGAYIHSEKKFIQIIIDNKRGLLNSFAESLRKATFNSKASTLQNKLIYDLSETLAVCNLIFDNNGLYLNKLPLVLSRWQTYGMED